MLIDKCSVPHFNINAYVESQDLEPEVTIDTVPNTKQKHEVNVGRSSYHTHPHSTPTQIHAYIHEPVKFISYSSGISNSYGFGVQNSVVVFAPYR